MLEIFEKNVNAINDSQPLIASWLNEEQDSYVHGENESVVIEQALNGESVIAINDGYRIKVIGSMYNPSYLAERYCLQFSEQIEDGILLLFGFGDGKVVRRICERYHQFVKIIVYEPDIFVFEKILEAFEVDDVLQNEKVHIIPSILKDEAIYSELSKLIGFSQRNKIVVVALNQYGKYYSEEYHRAKVILESVRAYKQADVNSLVRFANSAMENEIATICNFTDCYTISDISEYISDQSTCIIVAAGPSLNKNYQFLNDVNNHAFIMCVDSAVRFLINNGIVPHIVGTFDPEKGASYFQGLDMSRIPLLISGDSDWHAINASNTSKKFYLSMQNEFFHELFAMKNKKLLSESGGGSVATICFNAAVELGFKQIILVGQDLAFSDTQSHVDSTNDMREDMIYQMSEVEGYYGGFVTTRSDFRHYLEWYNAYIPTLEDVYVINATEGGARIHGATQLSLKDAIMQYCVEEKDWTSIIEKIHPVWNQFEERNHLICKLEDVYQHFKEFKEMLIVLLEELKVLLNQLKEDVIDENRIKRCGIDCGKIIDKIQNESEMMILMRSMMDVELNDTGLIEDSKHAMKRQMEELFEYQCYYFGEMSNKLDHLLALWRNNLDKIK